MAGIDKTYTDSYKDYKEFKDWADQQVVTFFDGHQRCIGDWVWDFDEKDFDGDERAIMNTPSWLDAYLIQNCPSKFVLDRMRSVYPDEFRERAKEHDFMKKPDGEYQQNRKVVIKSVPRRTKFPLHSKPYGGGYWWVQCMGDMWYNSYTGVWSDHRWLYPYDTNTSHVRSVKALVRHLRKQYLPTWAEFSLTGRYVGEDYVVKIK